MAEYWHPPISPKNEKGPNIREVRSSMDKWEYLTTFIFANAETQDIKDYIKKHWPEGRTEKFAPEALIPRLNDLGAQGWELVRIEPVSVGKNSDVLTHGDAGTKTWTNAYFCAFKRKLE